MPTRSNAPEEPDDDLPMDVIPLDQPASPIGTDDESDAADLDPEIRAALKKLGIAFRKEDDSIVEHDLCPVCEHLEPCKQLEKMMKEEDSEPKYSLKKMEEMLTRVQSILPRLTAESFSLLTPPESPVFVSMIPREDDFHSGIICGGVGDVPLSPPREGGTVKTHPDVSNHDVDSSEVICLSDGPSSPLKESEIVKNHAEVSIDFLDDSLSGEGDARAKLSESKTVKGCSDVSKTDLLSDATLLDLHLDDIFAKIESQTSRNPQGKSSSSEDFQTSPILGSQFVRKQRPSQMPPQPNPKKSLFPIFQSQNRKEVSEKAPEEPPLGTCSEQNISLDFDSFLECPESPEEKAKPPQKSSPIREALADNDNGFSPILSKSQCRPKLTNRASHVSESFNPSPGNRVPLPAEKTAENEEIRKEIEAFYEKSDDDMFAGLDDCCFDKVFNVSSAQKLDLDCGFIKKSVEVLELETSPKEKARPVSPPKVNLSSLVWMDKSNAAAVANVAPPQNRKKLSLKKSSASLKNADTTKKQSEKLPNRSPIHVPDCFQVKKTSQTPASKQATRAQPKNSSQDDDFRRIVPDLPLSPIAKVDPPVSPNCALEEFISLLPSSPDSSPKYEQSKSAEVVNRKRVLSSPRSPEMPRKKHSFQVESSPESPLFKSKKGFRRALDDTVMESQTANVSVKETGGLERIGSDPESPLFAKPRRMMRRLPDDTVALPRSNGRVQAAQNSGKAGSKPGTSRRARLSDSSDDEIAGRNVGKPEQRGTILKVRLHLW